MVGLGPIYLIGPRKFGNAERSRNYSLSSRGWFSKSPALKCLVSSPDPIYAAVDGLHRASGDVIHALLGILGLGTRLLNKCPGRGILPPPSRKQCLRRGKAAERETLVSDMYTYTPILLGTQEKTVPNASG